MFSQFAFENCCGFSGQYGFRTSHSTNLALNKMVNVVVNAIYDNSYSTGGFIYLKTRLSMDSTLLTFAHVIAQVMIRMDSHLLKHIFDT